MALLIGLGLWMWNSESSGGNGQEAKIPSDTIASSQGQEKLSEDKSASNTTKTETGTTSEAHQPKKLKVSKVEFGHCLAPQAGNTYEPRNMCDGNPSTTWAVGLYNYKPKGRFFCNQIMHNIFYISILILFLNIENFKEKAPTKSTLYKLIHKRLHLIWLQKNRPFAIKLS